MVSLRSVMVLVAVAAFGFSQPEKEVRYSAHRYHAEDGWRDTGECEVELSHPMRAGPYASPWLWIQAQVQGANGLPDEWVEGANRDLAIPPLEATVVNCVRRNWVGRESIDCRFEVNGDRRLFDGTRSVRATVHRAWRLPVDAGSAEVKRMIADYAAAAGVKVLSHEFKRVGADRVLHVVEIDGKCRPELCTVHENWGGTKRFPWHRSWTSRGIQRGEVRTTLEFEFDESDKDYEFVLVDPQEIEHVRVEIPKLSEGVK